MPKICPFLGAKLVPLTNFDIDGDVYTEYIPEHQSCVKEECVFYIEDTNKCAIGGNTVDFETVEQD